jgi:molybdopterin converting factor small subunit
MGMNMTCVDILYFGRASEFLLTTSERMEVPDAAPTLQQVLDRLRERGARWACELDERQVMCTVRNRPEGDVAFLDERAIATVKQESVRNSTLPRTVCISDEKGS